MKQENNYIDINRNLWNERTIHHLKSDFYDMEGFLAGKSSLKDIELPLLGDVNGKSLLHLQCHFGQDTLSLARMGAKVTGVDLSDKAIDTANELAAQIDPSARFICSDIYELPNVHNEQYDIVFTSYGTIGWLPDIKRWAGVVSKFLKPGGQFIFAEFHPAVWMFDNDFTYVQYSYFNTEAIVENEEGTYADKAAPIALTSVGWNHALAEVVQALINEGLTIEVLNEYDYSPWHFTGKTVKAGEDKYYIKGMEGKLPLVYALKAVKK
jgi:2-polyprenyl-3-methyl-5-hydroxy-6-metoxy-1,4-benzoquinol methylase